MQIRIYRGTHRIGGCVTEIKTNTSRIIIDMGEELPSAIKTEHSPLEIDGVTSGNPDCNAVLITHYHGDHIGMFERVLPQIPVYMGEFCIRAIFACTAREAVKRPQCLKNIAKT